MKLSFLGTGNAAQVPVYGCECLACKDARQDPSKARQHASVLVETATTRVLLDAGIDIREHFPSTSLDAIMLTHFHVDHVQGLFDLRWSKNIKQAVYTPPDDQGCADLYRNHGCLTFHQLEAFTSMELGDLRLTPLPLAHSKPTFGYLVEEGDKSFAYLTDTAGLPPDTFAYLRKKDMNIIAIDATYPPSAPGEIKGHNDVTLASSILDELQPTRGYLTHIGHDLDTWLKSNPLPTGISAAHDGLSEDI